MWNEILPNQGQGIRFTRYETRPEGEPAPCTCSGCVRFREMAPRVRAKLEASEEALDRAWRAAFPPPPDDEA